MGCWTSGVELGFQFLVRVRVFVGRQTPEGLQEYLLLSVYTSSVVCLSEKTRFHYKQRDESNNQGTRRDLSLTDCTGFPRVVTRIPGPWPCPPPPSEILRNAENVQTKTSQFSRNFSNFAHFFCHFCAQFSGCSNYYSSWPKCWNDRQYLNFCFARTFNSVKR